MTVTISPIYLTNAQTGDVVEGELWDQITEKQMQDWEADWKPELQAALKRLRSSGVSLSRWPQSRDWDWREKTTAVQGLLGYPGFSVMCDGVTQGLMIADSAYGRARLETQRDAALLYVEFLENAPWNRKELELKPRYRGVGSILMKSAIALSIELGFKGRVALHSLPQANDWYANSCGMTDLGMDAKKGNMRYFEMTPMQAEAFIAKGNKS